MPKLTFNVVYDMVRLIPKGKVMSYSGIARQCGSPHSARYVGFALHALIGTHRREQVPWWRVINARGYISNIFALEEQRRRLEAEGVEVGADYRVDMARFDGEAIVRRRMLQRSVKSLARSRAGRC
ncbi:MAG: MGMT family protein [Thermoflexales bacterium]